jgi:hypothetical protein
MVGEALEHALRLKLLGEAVDATLLGGDGSVGQQREHLGADPVRISPRSMCSVPM